MNSKWPDMPFFAAVSGRYTVKRAHGGQKKGVIGVRWVGGWVVVSGGHPEDVILGWGGGVKTFPAPPPPPDLTHTAPL